MVQRLSSIISIGGSIAASLPSSSRRANREISRLTSVQKEYETEAKSLDRQLKQLARTQGRNSDAYRQMADRSKAVEARLSSVNQDLTRANVQARSGSTGLTKFAGGLGSIAKGAGPVGIGLGVAVGAVSAFTAAIGKTADDVRNLNSAAALTGASVPELYRLGAGFETVTGSVEKANAAAADLAGLGARIESGLAFNPSGLNQVNTAFSRINTDLESFKSLDPQGQFNLLSNALAGLDLGQQRSIIDQLGLSTDTASIILQTANDVAKLAEVNRRAAESSPISDEDADKVLAYDNRIKEARKEVGEKFRSALIFGIDVMDKFHSALTPIIDSVKTWFQENREVVEALKVTGSLLLDVSIFTLKWTARLTGLAIKFSPVLAGVKLLSRGILQVRDNWDSATDFIEAGVDRLEGYFNRVADGILWLVEKTLSAADKIPGVDHSRELEAVRGARASLQPQAVAPPLPSAAPVVQPQAVAPPLPSAAPVVQPQAVPTQLPSAAPVVQPQAVPTQLPSAAPSVPREPARAQALGPPRQTTDNSRMLNIEQTNNFPITQATDAQEVVRVYEAEATRQIQTLAATA